MEQYKGKIIKFLKDNFKTLEVTEDMDIFATGGVNSLFAMQLMLFLQSEFEIEIDSDDLDISNFNTVNAMSNLVERKKNK